MDPFPEPSDLDCLDAARVALEASSVAPGDVASLELRWQAICESGPCGTPEPTTAQVILRYTDGHAAGVTIHRDPDGTLATGELMDIPSAVLNTPPPFNAPPVGLAPIENPPPAIASRPPVAFCGTEDAGLAGPFNPIARECFWAAVVNRQPAEFKSTRANAEGRPFVELWRFEGNGPIVVYTSGASGWSKLTCAMLLVPDHERLFDHTDCDQREVS